MHSYSEDENLRSYWRKCYSLFSIEQEHTIFLITLLVFILGELWSFIWLLGGKTSESNK